MTKILILDDEPLVGMMIDEYLYELGLKGISVSTTEAAITALPNCDCAILDLHMKQDKTSIPVAEKLREQNKPFIFLTGDPYRIVKGFEAIPKISKPINRDEFQTALEKHLGITIKENDVA